MNSLSITPRFRGYVATPFHKLPLGLTGGRAERLGSLGRAKTFKRPDKTIFKRY